MSKVDELKELGKENRGWRVTTATAKVIAAQLDEDDRLIVVLPIRDVWISGVRFRGIKPTVCLSKRRLVAVNHPGLFGRPMFETVDRDAITDVGAYADRTFDLKLKDGREIKLRGMIGERRVDEMTERLYAEVSSGARSAGH